MNIVIFTDTYYPDTNGIAVTCKTLVEVLKEHGHEVLVVTSIFDNKVPSNESYIHYLSFSSKKKKNVSATIVKYKSTIFKKIKAFKPDIVHNQTNDQIGQLGRYTASKLNVPFVFTYNSHFEEYAPYVLPTFFNRISRARGRKYLQNMMNISTEFIAPSLKIKNYLRKKGVDKYINVITTGLDPKKFECDEATKKDKKYLLKKYNINENDKVLVYVGSLSEEKNLDLLINSFKAYLDSEGALSCKLLIVGEGYKYDSLNALSKQLGIDDKVILVGKVNHDKIKSYFDLADVFVTASTSETQNMSAMEAMASKCLVLLKEDDALIGLIDKDKNGFVFNDDTQFVAELSRIFSLSDDEINKIKKNAYKTIETNFSLDSYYEKIMEVYNRAKRRKW